jgi:CheY-like chemotaxis protein
MPNTLLLVDDSVTIQRVIELTFADEDVRVVAVGDGRQAIERVEREPPDIVLADVGMPGCDGYEVASFVKNRPELAHIPVLLLTGAFEPVDEARVRQVRADGVLAKPFEPQELIRRVKALLSADAEQPTPGTVPQSPEAGDGTRGTESLASREQSVPPPTAPDEGEVTASGGGVSLDDYFDRLDAAFASLSVPSHIDEAANVPAVTPHPTWRDEGAAPDAAVKRLHSDSTVLPDTDRPRPSPHPEGGLTPSAIFAAFLEAEQAGQSAPGPVPGSLVPPPAYPSVEELVETVAQRVLAQLSDRIVREAVADIVSDVAERLVREEIERIKASIT